MKFEEENCIELPKYQDTFVYFLLKDNEVVYVGQTQSGISRPISHKDKDYDCIKLKYCKDYDLNDIEGEFILKYRPKYNKSHNPYSAYSFLRARDTIREKTSNKKFNIRDLKKIIKELGIETFLCIGGKSPSKHIISLKSFYKILNYIKEQEGKA